MEVVIVLLSLGLFLWRITTGFHMQPGYNYEADLGRDLLRMWEITQGDLTLLGPQLNFGGLRLAPYHFYLFAPFLALSKGKVLGVLLANALLFVGGLLFFYRLLKANSSRVYAILSTLYLLTSAYWLLSARTPGNAFSYLAALVVFLTVIFWSGQLSLGRVFWLSLLLSYAFHSHPVSLSVTLPLLSFRLLAQPQARIKKSLLAAGVFGVSFCPLIVFELTHQWIILKTLSSSHGVLSGGLYGFPNFTDMLALSFWGECLLLGVLIMLGKLRGRMIFFAGVGLATLGLYYLLRQSVIHYFFPLFMLGQFLLIEGLRHERWRAVFLALLLTLNLINFPMQFYESSPNLTQKEQNFARFLAKITLPRNRLNVVLLNDTHLSRVAYEYRFLLKKAGYSPLDEYSYKESNSLLVVDETGVARVNDSVSWEFREFGQRWLKSRHKVGQTVYYLYFKQTTP